MRDLIRRLQKYPVLGPTVEIEEAPPLPELQPLTEYVHLILYIVLFEYGVSQSIVIGV